MKKTIILAGVWITTLYLINMLLGENPSVRSLEYFPDMGYSRAAETQGTHPGLPNNMTQQLPVPGTIARGHSRVDFAADEVGRQRAGEVLVNPFAVSREESAGDQEGAPERGRLLYHRFCGPCHGAGGQGDGTVTRRGYPPPPSLFRPVALAYKEGEVFHIISYGMGNMPGYRTQIEPEDRWRIVDYVRWLQQSQAEQEESAP